MPEGSLVMMYLVFFVSLVSLAVLIINPTQLTPRFIDQTDIRFVLNNAQKTGSSEIVATVTNLGQAIELEAFATLANGDVVKSPESYSVAAEESATLTLMFSSPIGDATEVTLRERSGTSDLWHFS